MSSGSSQSPPKPGDGSSREDRLESWKEIAAYLRREVRTVQRWEKKEGLPVHRLPHDKLGTVFAFRSEIDSWWKERSALLEQEQAEPSGESASPVIAEAPAESSGPSSAESLVGPAQAAPVAPADSFATTPETKRKKTELIKRPVKRLATPVDVPLGIVILLVAVACIFLGPRLWRLIHPPPPPATKLMIAVKPFDNLNNNPEQKYFGHGLTRETISQLGLLDPDRLGVIGWQSSLHYENSSESISKIGHDLKVDYLLDGSYQLSGNRVKIIAQLYHVRSEQQTWSHVYEENLEDVLRVQSEIAGRIAKEIKLPLQPSERARLASAPPVIPDAYQAHSKGRDAISSRNLDEILGGIQLLERVTQLDPKYAPAFADLADGYNLLGFYAVMPPREAYSKSRRAAERALALDDSLAEAHTALADVNLHFDFDWDLAEKRFLEAIRLNPNYATAHHWYGVELALEGRTEPALQQMQQAVRLEPRSAPINTDVALVYFYAGEYEKAAEQCKNTLAIEPNYHMAHLWLARAYVQMKMTKEAKQEFQKTLELQPNNFLARALLAHAQATSGEKQEALATAHWFENQARQRYIPPTVIALIYAGLNDKENVFRWADKAYVERDPLLTRIKLDPILNNIRSDPRFAQLVQRVGPK